MEKVQESYPKKNYVYLTGGINKTKTVRAKSSGGNHYVGDGRLCTIQFWGSKIVFADDDDTLLEIEPTKKRGRISQNLAVHDSFGTSNKCSWAT